MAKFLQFGDILNKQIWRMILGELLGTALLVCLGCGSCVAPNSTLVGISLSFGTAVATIAQAIGHVSGAHLNPAVSLGLVAAGECSILKAVIYLGVQCGGALCGALILQQATPKELMGPFGTTTLSEGVKSTHGLLIEAVITFVLVLIVCGICDDLRKDIKGSAPLAIGLTLTLCHLWAVPLTGSSMNPARSFGPMLVLKLFGPEASSKAASKAVADHWVYWVGPILGGLAAGFLYRFTFHEKPASYSYADNPKLTESIKQLFSKKSTNQVDPENV